MGDEFKIMKFDGGSERWSQLPTLVLWMIKDRLDLVGNVYLSAVCKDWNLASASYPPNPQKCFAPFLMHRINKESSTCTLTNMSDLEKDFHCVIPKFDSEIMFLNSKGGWLLLAMVPIADKQPSFSVVLLHLQTNVKILMPEMDTGGFYGSFSSSGDGNPSCVVLAKCVEAQLTLYIANVGDEKWTKHIYATGRKVEYIASVAVVGSKIYWLNILGRLYTFDKSNLEWVEITGNSICTSMEEEESKISYMMESEEGEIMGVNVCIYSRTSNTFKFYKLNERQSYWEELSEKDTMGRSWFLSSTSQFTVTETTRVKKVFVMGMRVTKEPDIEKVIITSEIFISDLINKTEGTYRLKVMGYWVDLVRLVKLPPDRLPLL